MGWRFRRSVKLLPGVRLNFSKSGISTSVGGRGATVNFGPKGTRSTLGLPGSGISYSTLHSSDNGDPASGSPSPTSSAGCGCWGVVAIIVLSLLLSRCGRDDDVGNEKQVPAAATQSPTTTTKTVYVTADSLNARAGPSPSAPIVEKFSRGEKLDVAERNGEWAKVVQGGVTLWVAAQYLSDSFVPVAAPAPLSLIGRDDTAEPRRSERAAGGSCPCSSGRVCVGPRNGRYCITSGGKKRYGV